MSQVVVNMSADQAFLYECFSEAPLKPRRLNFSESPSSHNYLEENKKEEAPKKLFEVLGKAFLIMFEWRARLELLMQFTKTKVDQLNGDDCGKLIIPHFICGDFTIVRYFDHQPMSATSINQHLISSLRLIINKDIEASITSPPNHSLASNIDDNNITVTEHLEDSDYVSTLRDVNEDE